MNAAPVFSSRTSTPSVAVSPARRRFLVPEVVQTSAMDCGPATLKALLGGFGVDVHYGRLREVCQTSVDGTSIDTLEEVIRAFGLDATQTTVPLEDLVADQPQTLPAVVVVQRAGFGNHFILLWRSAFGRVQIMDPAVGRRWVRWSELEDTLYRHTAEVPVTTWLTWAEVELAPAIERRLVEVGVGARAARALVGEARASSTWLGWGALDAAVRFWASLRRGGLVDGVKETERAIRSLAASGVVASDERFRLLPRHTWIVDAEEPSSDVVQSTGILVVKAKRSARPAGALTQAEQTPELAAALHQAGRSAEQELMRFLEAESPLRLILLGWGVLGASAGMLVQTALLRHALDIMTDLGLGAQRVLAIGLLTAFTLLLGGLDFALFAGVLHVGRALETRLRISFLRKIPRLEDRFFASRLSSDMAERSHTMHLVRALPTLLYSAGRSLVGMVLTTAGIGLLAPRLLGWAAALTVTCLALPLAFRGVVAERDLRARTHLGGLARHHLDALVGITALRSHVGEQALRREHETQLVAWARTVFELLASVVAMRTTQVLAGAALSVALIAMHEERHGNAGATLLLAYWVMSLPELAHQFATSVQQYPACRNVALRCIEPLGAPEAPEPPPTKAAGEEHDGSCTVRMTSPWRGVALTFDRARVEVAGRTLLRDVSLTIAPGRHVAVVGSSGAGKSTLLGLLLGWHTAAAGRVYVDGEALDASALERLRARTAWVDPAVQLWNRSLLSNLAYGGDRLDVDQVARVLDAADLRGVVERLPDGMQGAVGEGGARLSGGEGQRLRFGRALLRQGSALALLDEPFRGLDRAKRRELLARAREHWKTATLLCVTHDVSETQDFDAVIVVEDGRIVEQGAPAALLAQSGSRYAELVASDEAVRSKMWGGSDWRRLVVGNGGVREWRA